MDFPTSRVLVENGHSPIINPSAGSGSGNLNFWRNILVESRSWRDRNLKFGPNCDLEVDNLEKNKKFGEAKPSQIFYFFPNYPPPDHNLWAKF